MFPQFFNTFHCLFSSSWPRFSEYFREQCCTLLKRINIALLLFTNWFWTWYWRVRDFSPKLAFPSQHWTVEEEQNLTWVNFYIFLHTADFFFFVGKIYFRQWSLNSFFFVGWKGWKSEVKFHSEPFCLWCLFPVISCIEGGYTSLSLNSPWRIKWMKIEWIVWWRCEWMGEGIKQLCLQWYAKSQCPTFPLIPVQNAPAGVQLRHRAVPFKFFCTTSHFGLFFHKMPNYQSMSPRSGIFMNLSLLSHFGGEALVNFWEWGWSLRCSYYICDIESSHVILCRIFLMMF